MTACDHRQLCLTDKEPDRIVGWSLTSDRSTATEFRLPAETRVVVTPEGTFLDGRHLAAGERLTPIVEAGTEITQYATCSRRDGHRGSHGYSPYRHPLRALRRHWWSLRRWWRRRG